MHIPFFLTLIALHLKSVLPKIHPFLIRANIIKKLDVWLKENLMKSRKMKLMLLIIMLATIGTFLPPIICWLMILLKHPVPAFTILTDSDWITVISIIVPAWMGALTYEKHLAMRAGIPVKDLDQAVEAAKNQSTQPNNTLEQDTNEGLAKADKRK